MYFIFCLLLRYSDSDGLPEEKASDAGYVPILEKKYFRCGMSLVLLCVFFKLEDKIHYFLNGIIHVKGF